jgi:hypothetical protein
MTLYPAGECLGTWIQARNVFSSNLTESKC